MNLKRVALVVGFILGASNLMAQSIEGNSLVLATEWVAKAEASFQEKAYKRCIKFSSKALKHNPQSPEAYFWKARAYEAWGKPFEAANEYRAALLARKDYSDAQDGLNRVLAQLGSVSADF